MKTIDQQFIKSSSSQDNQSALNTQSYEKLKIRHLIIVIAFFISSAITAMMIGVLRDKIIFLLLSGGILVFIIDTLKRSKKHIKRLLTLNQHLGERQDYIQHALNALQQQTDNMGMSMPVMAHELRNSVGGMTRIAEILLMETYRLPNDRKMLDLIKISGQNSLQLINDMLVADTNMEKSQKQSVNLYYVLHYCVDILNYQAREKGQYINLKATMIDVSVNLEQLWQVICNLLDNAIKFSPNGARINVVLQNEAPAKVRITIEDHGIGIPEEIAAEIFDMFTKSKRPGTAGEPSFGLGLAISRQVLDANGGRIWFESKQGDGTVFFVELPVMFN